MKRIYMDISEQTHESFMKGAKDQKRTLKGFLEWIIESYFDLKIQQKREVKKNAKNKTKRS